MERIKQAIDKARQQAAHAPASGASPRPLRPNHVKPAGGGVAQAASSSPSGPSALDADHQIEVSYTHTEVVELDPVHLEQRRVVAFNKANPNNWAFDVLRTQVLQKMDEKGWRTLAITSPTQESGKTVLAINLAMSMAHHTQRTAVLVDFDLRRPRVASYLGIQKTPSLNEVFSGDAELPDALVNPNLPRLVVLPTNRPVPKAAELLSSKKIAHMIRDLRERYQDRIVIFDLPPMMAGDDVMAVLPNIDCVLMVVGNGNSTRREIEESMRHVPADRLLGVVLNKAEAATRQGYY
ncbi:CpsD/CapB family tyrosine-protein kinase [Hydrogenophaga atypica]|uniref:CpsD/CapB family tyrosine-protein kinase n=1 Tax=Hydrogenophaga atypica TaxID=249409 RepID=A0ABW2QHJ1_9BURK